MSVRGCIYHRKFNGKLARNWTIKLDGLTTKTGQKAISVKWDKRLTAAQNKTLAEQKMRELLTAHDKGVFIEPTALTVAELLRDFIDHPGKRRPKTIRVYKTMIDKHLVPALGHHRVQQLQPEHLEDFYKTFGATHAPRSVRLVNAALSAALTRGMKNSKVFRNVARMVAEEFPTLPPTTRRALSDERTAEVLATANLSAQERALLEFIFKTGVRVSEACGVWWGDVDLTSGVVKIQRQLATPAKVREKLVPAIFDAETKNHESPAKPREIPLTARTIKALRAHQVAQMKVRMAHGLGKAQDTDPVFASEPPAKYVGVPLSQEFVRRMFKRVAGVNPHIARHTIATSMEAAGESANTIAAHLGDSAATVQKNYIHTRPEHQQAAVARLDERFYGGAKNR